MTEAAVHLTYADGDGRPQCPGCNSYRVTERHLRGVHSVGDQIHDCMSCAAVFGTFARMEDSYQYVDDKWCGCKPQEGSKRRHVGDPDQRYFDFTGRRPTPGGRHGWYHPDCCRLTQVG